jgi:uncharacterized protein (DUF2249 family)
MDVIVDVRAAAPRDRHALVLRAFDRLPAGEALLLIDDHDPGALFRRLQAEDNGEFTWAYVETGAHAWRVRIGKPRGGAPRLCGCALAAKPAAHASRPAPVSS